MNIILVTGRNGRTRELDMRSPATFGLSVFAVLFVLVSVFVAGSFIGAHWAQSQPANQLKTWSAELDADRQQIDMVRRVVQQHVDALATRVGQMNAHVIRLDALGRRLSDMAKLKKGEFNFDQAPQIHALGNGSTAVSAPVLTDLLDQLAAQIADRERQLGVMENLIESRELRSVVDPRGKPIKVGYISSFYGERLDPITGDSAFHSGVDFAGDVGSRVVASGAGIVTWAGVRPGYGMVVEIAHGDGYLTRYAHNSQLLVRAGDAVQKGQAVSLLGTTGHSTGPHVHFEVLRDGIPVDPLAYVGRTGLPVLPGTH